MARPPKLHLFRSYPTYEEWKQKLGCNPEVVPKIVLILPMRNGNEQQEEEANEEGVLSSYPTYEEWKRVWSVFAVAFPKAFLSYL